MIEAFPRSRFKITFFFWIYLKILVRKREQRGIFTIYRSGLWINENQRIIGQFKFPTRRFTVLIILSIYLWFYNQSSDLKRTEECLARGGERESNLEGEDKKQPFNSYWFVKWLFRDIVWMKQSGDHTEIILFGFWYIYICDHFHVFWRKSIVYLEPVDQIYK